MLPRSPRFRAAGPAARLSRVMAIAIAATLSPIAVPARAAEPGISVGAPWFRLIIASRPAAGYAEIGNDGAQPRTLVGAKSPGCGTLLLHRSVSRGGVEQMDMVDSIAIPAHGHIAFAPGGYHLMCMSPSPSLKPGGSVPVTLSFADGRSVTAAFAIRNALGK